MKLEEALKVLSALEAEGVRYVMIGSMALAAQGIVRATRDIDLMVASDRDNVERIKRALRATFHDDSIDEIGPDDLAGPYPVIRYGPPTGDFIIDLIARVGDAFSFDSIESEELIVEDVRIRVATPEMLFKMKRGTMRAQDRADAESLRDKFGFKEDV
ncbi:MAG: nucleotidyl transferase AbiEii/AbiGii toxin family protein [Actinomycetota bacterium]